MTTLQNLPRDRSVKRRLVTTTALFTGALVALALLPLTLPLALVVDLIRRRQWSTLRTTFFLTFFLCFEAFGLLILFKHWLHHKLGGLDDEAYEQANREMQHWWVRGFFTTCLRTFSVRLSVDGLSALDDRRPALIYSRHASTLDTLIPMALLDRPKRLRYTLKEALLYDPALDYCGQRLPNVFVRRGSQNRQREVQKVIALADDLGDDDAVVLFPEGTRFSDNKRARLLEKFDDDPQMLPVVQSLSNTLPPLRQGAIELIKAAPDADLVLISHRGIEDAVSMADLLGGHLTGAHLQVRSWRIPASHIPRTDDAIRQFLVHQWQRVDAFATDQPLGPLYPDSDHQRSAAQPDSRAQPTPAPANP